MEGLKDTGMNPGTPEERLALLERKMREMEALVKGLTEELLDLKSIAMRLNKVSEEQRMNLKTGKPVLAATPVAAGSASSGSVTVRPRVPAARVEPQAPEPPKEEPMEMIMQTDGTLKPEKRKAGGEYVVASAGYGQKKKMGAGDAKRKDNLIVAEEDDKAAKKS